MAGPADPNYLVRNSATVAVFQGLGVASGIALDAVIVGRLGLSVATDAFFAAFAVPFIITSVLELQTTTVLVPVLIRLRHEEGAEACHRLVSSLITLAALLLGGVAALGALAARSLIDLQAPGLRPAGLDLAISLAGILFWLTPLAAGAAVLRAALNSVHRFAAASSSKLIGNMAALVVVLAAYGRLGIHALAYGFLIGAGAQLLVLLLAMSREGYLYFPAMRVRERQVGEVGRLLLYNLLGQTLSESRQLVENFVASFFPPGSLSALRYASRIVNSISGVLVGGIVTAMLPLISLSTALRDTAQLKRVLAQGVRLLALVALPISVWLTVASRPFVAVMFERGSFSAADTALTSSLIVWLLPVIFLSRLIALAQTPFYARQEMLTPLWNTALGVAAYVGLVLLLRGPMGIYGLPLANSLALALAVASAVWLLRRSIGGLGAGGLANFFVRLSAALATMFASMAAAGPLWRLAAGPAGRPFFELAALSASGAMGFGAAAWLLGILDFGRLSALLRRPSAALTEGPASS
jgi:putative peptidoglycan lipid II flippase